MLRSSLLIATGMVLSRMFSRNAPFQSRLWNLVFICLGTMLVWTPTTNLNLNIDSIHLQRPTSHVYELDPGFTAAAVHSTSKFSFSVPTSLIIFSSIVGVIVFGFRVAATWRVIRCAEQCNDAARISTIYDACERLGVSNPPLLLISDRVISPSTAGLLNPVLLIPANTIDELCDEDWQCILFHELSHLKRLDNWRLVFWSAVGAVFCWNPLMWFAQRDARLAVEMSCDLQALKSVSVGVRTYLNLLTARQHVPTNLVFAKLSGSGSVVKRVRNLSQDAAACWPNLSLIALFLPFLSLQSFALSHRYAPDRIAPDEIVFWSDRSGKTRLYRMTIDGKDQQPLSDSFIGAWLPSISPDGRKIAYARGPEDKRHVYFSDTAGTSEHCLAPSTCRDDQPVFSPDGKKILFIRQTKSEGWKIGLYDIATGTAKFVRRGYESRFHPGGQRITMSYNDSHEVQQLVGEYRRFQSRADDIGSVEPDWRVVQR